MKRLILSTVCILFCATGLWAVTLIDGIYYNLNASSQTATVTNKIGNSSGSNSYSGSITIPSTVAYNGTSYSVTSIGSYAFYNCDGLTSVTIPNSVTSIGSAAFSGCSGLTSITIPNSVTSIGYYAFEGCTGLTSVTIPNSVTSIGSYAFSGCGIPVYNAHIFAHLPVSYSGKYSIPDGIETIVSGAFSKCSGLTSVTIPNSVTSIGSSAFSGCSGLTNVTIPNSVTSIGSSAFYNCSGLTSITIPNSVTSIGGNAFEGCTGLTSVTIPNSVTSIGGNAFEGCTGLTNVTIPNSVTSIEYGMFYNCTGLTNVTIPNSVTWIGNLAFYNCTGLTSIEIPNSVTSIGGDAFYNCTGLTSIIVPCEKHDYFVGMLTEYAAIIYEDCTFEVAVNANNEDYGTVTGSGVFKMGQTIQLTATANEGYRFKGWSDGVMDASREIIVTKDTIITANFVALYTIKALANASQGTVSGGGLYEIGETATLVANAKTGYTFAQWVDGNDENPRTVTVNGNKTYTAIFAIDEHNVTLSKNISAAGTVTGDGVYEYNTTVQLTATANEGYRFKGWSDGVMDASREITVTKDTSITANFVALYTIKALASASQGTVSGGGVYEDGEIATLVANAKAGYTFAQWVDGNDENPRTVTVNGNKTYTAIFAINEYNVTADKNISAAGTVTGDGVYEHNTTVQLTATANEGYRFKGWSDGVTDASREIIVTKDTSITANFVALYTIKALASASQGTVIGGGVYEDGETVTLVANPNPGYIFTQWVDGSDENPRTVTVDENKTYTAIFIEEESETTAVSETEESIVETARYDINGRPLTAPTKGVNIVKYSDGSFEKEFVR